MHRVMAGACRRASQMQGDKRYRDDEQEEGDNPHDGRFSPRDRGEILMSGPL